MPASARRLVRLREIEVWIARVRLGAVGFAAVEVGFTLELPADPG